MLRRISNYHMTDLQFSRVAKALAVDGGVIA